nr:hypothetical protein [Bacilli bacterium]
MGLFHRAAKIVQAEVQDRKQKAMSVQEQLELHYQSMLSAIGETKLMIAEVKSRKLRLEEQVALLLSEESTLEQKAKETLRQEDESAARDFLVKKREKQAKRIGFEEKIEFLSQKIMMLEQSYEAMREKVKDFMEQRDELEADLSAAKAQLWMTQASDLMDKAKNSGLEALAQETRVAQAQVSLHQTFDEEFEAFVRSTKESAP